MTKMFLVTISCFYSNCTEMETNSVGKFVKSGQFMTYKQQSIKLIWLVG